MSPKKSPTKKGLWILILIVSVLNLSIVLSGKTYLYKGIQETYLKGRTAPGIYDSISFPTRTAKHSLYPEKWEERASLIQLNEEELTFLKEFKTTSLLIIKDQKIISETYFENHTSKTKSNSFSAGKSFIGLLIGIAIDEGKIKSFDEPINNYLPFYLENSDEVTIRDVLEMSSGLEWSESGKDPFSNNAEAYYTKDIVNAMKKTKFDGKKEHPFVYKSGNSELLGFILKEATGKYPTEYLEEKVWSKIGTEDDVLWSLDDKDGWERTFCCVYATTRDYGKFGQLMLNEGKWGNETIVKRETYQEMIAPINEQEDFYGLHFWRYNHPKYPTIYARGILGQYIMAIPSLNVVMVRTGHYRLPSLYFTEEQHADKEFMEKNRYKEYHAEEMDKYYSILERVLNSDSL